MAGKGKMKALPAMSNNTNTSSFCLDLALAPFGSRGRKEGLQKDFWTVCVLQTHSGHLPSVSGARPGFTCAKPRDRRIQRKVLAPVRGDSAYYHLL